MTEDDRYFSALFQVPLLGGWSLGPLLEAGTQINQELIRRFGLPPLFRSGVRYEREPPGQEIWLIGDLLDIRGRGDCEDLAMRRAAELREAGEHSAKAVWKKIPGRNLFHIVTQRGDGTEEDTSRILGM